MTTESQPLRALILEDEWVARNYLTRLVEGSGLAEVVGGLADVAQARQALEASKSGFPVDVMFVDVHLVGDGAEAGLDLVRSLAGVPDTPTFVLATASERHAIAAFELGVVDYLRKPFSQERVNQCLQRIIARRPARLAIAAPSPSRIVARRKKSLVFLRPEEVLAFEASDRLASVHSTLGVLEIDLSLAAIESSMGRGFLRVHRNWLVNLEHVREIVRDEGEHALLLAAASGAAGAQPSALRVPVARERAQAVRDLLLSNATGVRKS